MKERVYANPLEWKLMVAKNTGHTVVTYDELSGLVEAVDRLQAEIKDLREHNHKLAMARVEEAQYLPTLRAEAIKEFADELRFRLSIGTWKHKNVLLDDCKWIIDNLVKEMVGEDK